MLILSPLPLLCFLPLFWGLGRWLTPALCVGQPPHTSPKRHQCAQAQGCACCHALVMCSSQHSRLSASSRRDAYLLEPLQADRCSYLCCSLSACTAWEVCGKNARKKLWVWKPEAALWVFLSRSSLLKLPWAALSPQGTPGHCRAGHGSRSLPPTASSHPRAQGATSTPRQGGGGWAQRGRLETALKAPSLTEGCRNPFAINTFAIKHFILWLL